MTSVTVHALFCYPIKSLGGVRLEEAHAEGRGLRHDRRWMLVDERGEFMSQRRHPRMTLASVAIGEAALAVKAPGGATLRVPFAAGEGPARRVRVWRDEVEAVDEGDEAAAFFAGVTRAPCRLVRMAPSARRRVDPEYAAPDDVVSFADAFPFLFLSTASIDALNAKLAVPVDVRRFRPNVLVTGCAPFEEDRWARVRVGGVPFRLVKPCARCQIVTVDPDTAAGGKQPLATLATFRTGEGKRRNKVLFGQNALADGEGTLRIGDRVEVLEAGSVVEASA